MATILDYRAPKRRELIALALAATLLDIKEPMSTADVVARIARILESPGEAAAKRIGQDLMSMARSIPEAVRSGATFKLYGRTMARWVWYPKGKTASGPTRQAKRRTPSVREMRRRAKLGMDVALPETDNWEV